MKRFWTAAALIALLLAASLGNAWYAGQITGAMTRELERARELAGEDRWGEAQTLTRQAYDRWQGHHFYLHTVMRHSDTDQILRSFRSVLEYLALQEPDQYNAANADLIAQLELLAEMEQASLVNVL